MLTTERQRKMDHVIIGEVLIKKCPIAIIFSYYFSII